MAPPNLSSRVDDIIPPPRARATIIPTGLASRKLRAILDQLAGGVVWVGGIATIISIMGIFVYLLIEVAPLFMAPSGSQQAIFPLEKGT